MAAIEQAEKTLEFDTEAAQRYLDEANARRAALEEEAKALTGKDNAKARKEKSKQASDIKNTNEFIDAEKVMKGKDPPHGNFVKKTAVAVEPATTAEQTTDEHPGTQDVKADKKEKKE